MNIMYDIKDRIEIMLFETIEEEKERRKKKREDREKVLKEIENKGVCEGVEGKCDCKKDVTWINSRTFYSWDIDEEPLEDPNRSIFLCPHCAEVYNRHWQDRWDDYYAGLL